MRTFSFPAAYRHVVESSLALALADIGRDQACRADEDVRVRALAPVPDKMLCPGATGHITVLLVSTEADGVVNSIAGGAPHDRAPAAPSHSRR